MRGLILYNGYSDIPSYDHQISRIREEFEALGFTATLTEKGGVIVDLGGVESAEGGRFIQAHADTLGGMVAEIKGNGRLRRCGMLPEAGQQRCWV